MKMRALIEVVIYDGPLDDFDYEYTLDVGDEIDVLSAEHHNDTAFCELLGERDDDGNVVAIAMDRTLLLLGFERII